MVVVIVLCLGVKCFVLFVYVFKFVFLVGFG